MNYVRGWKRMWRYIASLVLVVCLTISMQSCDDDDDPGEDVDNAGFTINTVASGLDTPWQLAIADDGRIFFTERKGHVRIIENGNLVEQPWLAMDSVVEEVGESGLTGIALHPNFAQNGYFYLAYTYAVSMSPIVLENKLVRYRENEAGNPVFDKVLIEGVRGNHLHNMGTLAFGPDGKLYCAVGEVFEPELAQDLDVLNGKILRINDDGSVPEDNPYPGSYIFSYGHRNPQGLAFHPETQALYATEHGPSEQQGCCRDEINLIEAGNNYGWPIITGDETNPGMMPPITHSGATVTWAPGGATFVSQGDWQGSLLFVGLFGESLYRVVFAEDNPEEVVEVEQYFHQRFGRLRNIVEAPDGTLYVSVSNRDGRGFPQSDDDRILSLRR